MVAPLGPLSSAYSIAFVLPNLSGGGAARVASILCNQWSEMGHKVDLITFEEAGVPSAYPVSEAVRRHQLGFSVSPVTKPGFLLNNVRRVISLRKTLRKIEPAVVMSFLLEANTAAVIAGRSLGLPVIISERNHPGYDKVRPLNERIRSTVYPRASRLCVQTNDIRRWFKENLNLDAAVIPNPVEMGSPVRRIQTSGERRRAIAIGRLEFQKGYDRLIKAFGLIADEVPDWDIVIFGEGSLRPQLQQQISELGLDGRISLRGVTDMPGCELRFSDLFIHTARFEGFPNAVIEALGAGLCVLATDCPGATGEILGEGKHGLLVPPDDAHLLAEAMRSAMQDRAMREAFAANAPNAVEHLSPDAIAQRWLGEIETLAVGADSGFQQSSHQSACR